MTSFVRSVLFGLLVAAVGPLAAAPVPGGAKYEPPTLAGQVASVQRVIDEVVGFAKSVDPRTGGQVEQGLADLLGEKGWAGLDVTKPVGVFAYVRPKLEFSYPVFVFPITKEADALDLLARLGVQAEEEPRAKGVYRLYRRDFLPAETPVRLRFHDKHAYVGVNADPDELAPAKLIPAGDLIDPKETAPLAVTFYPARAPKELKEVFDGWWAGGRATADQLAANPPGDMPKSWPPLAKAALGWLDAGTVALFQQADTVALRVKSEPKTSDFAFEVTVSPKAETELAANVAAVKPAPGRFHQLVSKDAVGGAWLTYGSGFPKGVREKVGPFAADLIGYLQESVPAPAQPVIAAFAQQAKAMLADGKTDFGMAMLGPDKNDNYTAVAAVALPDPSAIEKAVRKLVDDLPEAAKGFIKLDAEKAGELSIHTVTLPDVGEWVETLFGKNATIRMAFGKDAVYLAVGPDGLKQIERAAGLKATDCKRMDIVMNPKKMGAIVTAMGGGGVGPGGNMVEIMFGKGDALQSQGGIDLKGGKTLTVTYTQYRMGLLMGLFGWFLFSF